MMRTIALYLFVPTVLCYSRRVISRNRFTSDTNDGAPHAGIKRLLRSDTRTSYSAPLNSIATLFLSLYSHSTVTGSGRRSFNPSVGRERSRILAMSEEGNDELKRAIQLLSDKFTIKDDPIISDTSSEELREGTIDTQAKLAQQASDAYSWSLEGLRNSQGRALDAYAWSVEAASNATAAVSETMGGLQYPALVPRWVKDLLDSGPIDDSDNITEVKDDGNEGLFAVALALVFLFESVGPVSLALIGMFYFSSFVHELGTLSPLLYSEAAFYLLCCSIAIASTSDTPSFASLDKDRRRLLWRRMLSDPSQSPSDFVEGWMYRDSEVAEYSPPELFIRYLLQGVGLLPKPNIEHLAAYPGRRMISERYGVPWEDLSIGDVYAWLCRSLYSKGSCQELTAEEDLELREFVEELEDAAGLKFSRRGSSMQTSNQEVLVAQLSKVPVTTDVFGTSPGISSISAPTPVAPLRWRHRPLLWYALTQGVYGSIYTPVIMQKNGFTHRDEGTLSYWYRAGNRTDGDAVPDALVFIHGIGFGVGPYVEAVLEMADHDVDVLMIELPGASQNLFSSNPIASEFGDLVIGALDSLGLQRCVVVGHSLGTSYASYLAHHDARTNARRVGGIVLIDPIPTTIHHARTMREVVYTRLDTMQSSVEDFLFKKELWTCVEVQHKFPWPEAAFWLEECFPQTPTLIAVGSADVIMKPLATSRIFSSWQARLRGVRVLNMEGNGHGEWLFSEDSRSQLIQAIQALRTEAATIGAAEAAVTVAAADISEVTSAVAADISKATSKASASLLAATDLSLDQVAEAYEEAVAEADWARISLEDGFAKAATEAELSFNAFENETSQFFLRAEEAFTNITGSDIRSRLELVRNGFEQDFARIVSEVNTKEDQSLGRDIGELQKIREIATVETKLAKGSLERDFASLASTETAKGIEAMERFEQELTNNREIAAETAVKTQQARNALVDEVVELISNIGEKLQQSKSEQKENAEVK